MKESDLLNHRYYTKDGKEIWKTKYVCMVPSIELENVETGEVVSFGINGIIAKEFIPVNIPKIG